MPTTSRGPFEELLAELWCACADNQWLRASPAYERFRGWLSRLSWTCPRAEADLNRLQSVLGAVRDADDGRLDELLRDERCPPAPVRQPRPPAVTAAQAVAADNSTADCKLLAALETTDDCVGLQRFFREVAALTCDHGELLMRVTGEMLADFRAFVNEMFGNRVTQIGMVLAREQMSMRERYAQLEGRTMNRAQMALLHVQYLMPSFVWQRYVTEKGYMGTMVASMCPDQTPNDDDPDADDTRGKSLLYQLNWLRTEIERAECETHGLKEQHGSAVVELAEINRNIANAQCRAAADMAAKVAELDALRRKSVEQVCTIDMLMETIHMSIQMAKADSAAASAATDDGLHDK